MYVGGRSYGVDTPLSSAEAQRCKLSAQVNSRMECPREEAGVLLAGVDSRPLGVMQIKGFFENHPPVQEGTWYEA